MQFFNLGQWVRMPSLLVLVLLQAVSTASPLPADESNDVKPRWDESTIRLGEFKADLLRRRDYWPFEKVLGGRLVQIAGHQIRAVDANFEVLWEQTGKSEKSLRFLAVRNDVLYCTEDSDDSREEQYPEQPILRRMDLKTGQWHGGIIIPTDERIGEERTYIQNALVVDGGLFVLSITVKDSHSTEPIHYRLSKVAEEIEWSKSFESGGGLPNPSAFVLGSLGPARDSQAIVTLTLVNDKVLVCAGPREPLMMVSPDSGDIAWTLPRIWEFRRGFIGPSVWEHFMGRYGFQNHDVELAEKTLEEIQKDKVNQSAIEYNRGIKNAIEEARTRIEKESCAIVAGPVVVIENSDGFEEKHFFLVTSQNSDQVWDGYLSECVVYEIAETGTVLKMLKIPRFVSGRDFRIDKDKVIWKSQRGDELTLFATRGWNTADCMIEMNWNRYQPREETNHWLQQETFFPSTVIFETTSLSLESGGYIKKEDSKVMSYPIWLKDLSSGAVQKLLLEIPFNGTVRPPETNYSRQWDGLQNEPHWTTYGRFLMILRGLQILDDRLLLKLEYEDENVGLEFRLKDVLHAK